MYFSIVVATFEPKNVTGLRGRFFFSLSLSLITICRRLPLFVNDRSARCLITSSKQTVSTLVSFSIASHSPSLFFKLFDNIDILTIPHWSSTQTCANSYQILKIVHILHWKPLVFDVQVFKFEYTRTCIFQVGPSLSEPSNNR